MTISPICAEFSSRLEQLAPQATVKDYCAQLSGVHKPQLYGQLSSYPTTHRHITHKVALLVFSDAARSPENAQLSYLACLLLCDMRSGFPFHFLSCISYKSRRPVHSIGAAENLAAGKAIDEGKMLAQTMSSIFNFDIPLVISLDSGDLFTSLCTHRNSVDKSNRCNVNVIR